MNVARPALRSFSTGILPATFVFGLMVPLVAFAELSNEPLLGPGLRLRPAYDGSASQRAELVPVVRYFGQHWFARSTQGVLEGGARIALAPGLHAGAQLAYEPGRRRANPISSSVTACRMSTPEYPSVCISIVVGSMETRHLRGDAVSSPLAERASNYYASAGIAYRF